MKKSLEAEGLPISHLHFLSSTLDNRLCLRASAPAAHAAATLALIAAAAFAFFKLLLGFQPGKGLGN